MSWGRSCGAFWHDALEVHDGPRGRGIFVKDTAAITRDEVLLRIPAELAVRPSGEIADLVKAGHCSHFLALVLTTLHELHVAKPRKPYFDFLAGTPPPHVPMLWSDAELTHLLGTTVLPCGGAADAASAAFATHVTPLLERLGEGLFPTRVRDERLFATVLAQVMSRTVQGRVSYEHGSPSLWPYLGADGPATSAHTSSSGPFMLPLFDILNHSSCTADLGTVLRGASDDLRTVLHGPAEDTVGDPSLRAYELRAERAISAGEELLHSYGPACVRP